MKRKMVSLLILSLPLLLAAVILQFPVTAAPVQQTVPAETTEAEGTPLLQPQQIVIRQQLPLTFTVMVATPITGATTTTDTTNLLGAFINSLARPTTVSPTLSVQTIGVTLTLDLQLTVTDTLTTTVPSTVTLTLANQQSTTLPVSLTIGALPAAQVVITLLPPTAPITVEAPITTTVELTPTVPVSPTAGVTATGTITTPIIPGTAAITGTAIITANLRSGPDTTFEAVGTAPGGQSVTVVAQNADGSWYLLNNGLWIAAALVDNVQGGLPLATDELATTLRAQAVITPTTAITPTTPITTTPAVTTTTPVTTPTTVTATATPTATGPTLVPTAAAVTQPVVAPSVTVNANLRSGPGPTFPIIGGTITGQVINIVARNEDASWFLLDNGGWVSATLVANPPAAATVPLFAADQPANTLAPTATPIPPPAPPPTTTTATTATTTTTTTTTTRVLGVQENVYVIRVDGIVDGYDFSLNKIDELITQASSDETQLRDQAWIVEMTTAITLLRSNSEEVNTLTPPPLFAEAHAILTEAAATFTTAAGLLEAGITAAQPNIARLDEAFAEITVGTSLLTRAQDAIEAITP
jgi:uncharacterized protein YraI